MTTFEQQLDNAWKLISPVGKVTITYLQLKMGIGFNRAAKIIDGLEKRGVITTRDPNVIEPRKVLKPFLRT